MQLRHTFSWPATLCLLAFCLISGCSSIDKFNPFTDIKPAEVYRPANATEYLCESNKQFYVRNLQKEEAVWLIFADREIRLEKTEDGRYSNSVALLEINGSEASLKDGAVEYNNCKAVDPQK